MENHELWARSRAGLAEAAALNGLNRPDGEEALLLMAGYLEGRLDEAGQARVEAWLVADPAALELMLASRADLDAPGFAEDPAAAGLPRGLADRAKGLVRETSVASGQGAALPSRLLDRVSGWILGGPGGFLQPVGVAAALLVAVLVGAELAHSSFANLMAPELAWVESDLGLAGDDLL